MSASMQSSNGPETGSLRHHSVPASPVCVRECVCECECECEASSGPRVPPTAAPSASASPLAVPPPPSSPASSSSRVRTRLQLCLLLASVGALTGLCSTAINISVFMLAGARVRVCVSALKCINPTHTLTHSHTTHPLFHFASFIPILRCNDCCCCKSQPV